MAQHLDIKLFTDILNEIKNVSFINQRSMFMSTAIDIIPASDTDGEHDDNDRLKAIPIISPIFLRKPSNLAMMKKSSTTTNLVGQLGIDPVIIQEMMADGYDPTQTTEWQLFRQQTIGDSEMLTTKDKVEDWRTRRNSIGHVYRNREGDRSVEN